MTSAQEQAYEPVNPDTRTEDKNEQQGNCGAHGKRTFPRNEEMYAGKSAIKNRQTRIERRRQRLINAWVRAVKAGDMEKAQRTMDKITVFNQKNPAFTITGGTLTRSYRQRLNVQARTQQGVYLPARKSGLRDVGRFANVD